MATEPAEIVEVLKAAAKAVDDAGVPEPLREVAFMRAVDLLTGGATDRSQIGGGAPPSPGGVGEGTPGAKTPVVEGEGPLPAIANRLGLDRETVENVFDVEDGELKIVLPTSSLESAKGPATRQLALLFAVARQAAGIEEWTFARDIREVTKEFNKFDTSNFAQVLNGMDEVFRFTGSGPSERRVKVTRQGYERATALVRQLSGGDA